MATIDVKYYTPEGLFHAYCLGAVSREDAVKEIGEELFDKMLQQYREDLKERM